MMLYSASLEAQRHAAAVIQSSAVKASHSNTDARSSVLTVLAQGSRQGAHKSTATHAQIGCHAAVQGRVNTSQYVDVATASLELRKQEQALCVCWQCSSPDTQAERQKMTRGSWQQHATATQCTWHCVLDSCRRGTWHTSSSMLTLLQQPRASQHDK